MAGRKAYVQSRRVAADASSVRRGSWRARRAVRRLARAADERERRTW